MSVRTHEISTLLYNCMVWREYKHMVWHEYRIRPFLNDLMVNFKWGICHVQISSTNSSMMLWWVMLRKLIPHVLTSWFPINVEVFLFYPVLHPIKMHVHCLGLFCLTVAATIPLAADLSVFNRVGGMEKPSSWSVTRRGTSICQL